MPPSRRPSRRWCRAPRRPRMRGRGAAVGDGCRGRHLPLRGRPAAHAVGAAGPGSRPHRHLTRDGFKHRVTQGRIVDRASGRLEKPGGCALGELPKRPKGSDCKSAVLDFGGSNPSLATNCRSAPLGALSSFLTMRIGDLGRARPRRLRPGEAASGGVALVRDAGNPTSISCSLTAGAHTIARPHDEGRRE